MMRMAILVAGGVALVLALAAPARAGDKVQPWQFKATKDGKAVGRYDFSVVTRDNGVFAVSMTYGSAKVLGKKKPGRPEVRAYAELDPKGLLGRYKRWKAKGKGALYWMAFVLDGKAKTRFEKEDGKDSKVTDLGPADGVVPLETDQPFLGWLLVRGRAEVEVPCMGSSSTTIGKARVRKDGAVEGGETWKIEGDCGTFAFVVDGLGEPRSITADGRAWERMAPATE